MNKRLKYLLAGLAVLLLAILALPMLFIPSPWVQRISMQVPYPAAEVFYGIDDLSGWDEWAWPWSEEPGINIMWYDDTNGPMSGFYFESKREKIGNGVIELRKTEIPHKLFFAKINKERQQEPFSFSIKPLNDSVSVVEKRVEYDSGNLPWERLLFWIDAASKKRKAKKELISLGEYLAKRTIEKEESLE